MLLVLVWPDWTVAVIFLVAAAANWWSYSKAPDQWRRRVFLGCTVTFVALAVFKLCFAIWR